MSSPPSLDECLREVDTALADGRLEDAVDAVFGAMQIDREDPRTLPAHAAVLAALEGRRDRTSLLNRSVLRAQTGDFEGARRDLDMAVGVDPLYAISYAKRAMMAFAQEDPIAAFTDAHTALVLAPAEWEHREGAEMAFATARRQLEDRGMLADAAAPLGARAVEIASAGGIDSAFASLDMTEVLFAEAGVATEERRGRITAVIAAMRGNVFELAGEDANAIPSYDCSLAELRTHGVLTCKARVLLRSGAYAEALELLDEAVVMHPQSIDAHRYRGAVLAGLGRWEPALDAIHKAHLLEPATPPTMHFEARILAKLGRLDASIRLLEECVAREPLSVEAWIDLGIDRQKAARFDDAIDATREAIRLHPQSAVAHYSLACTLALKGDRDGAIASVREALRIDPSQRGAIATDTDFASVAGDERFVALTGGPTRSRS